MSILEDFKNRDFERTKVKLKSMSIDWENIFNVSQERGVRICESFVLSNVYDRAETRFCTGSTYTGQWNVLGLHGTGNYTIFDGAVYSGSIKDGQFHGSGKLTFPNGANLVGRWNNGRLVSHSYYFADRMCYGPYCEMPNRKFFKEIREGLKPAGRSNLTNDMPTRTIPEGCYDVGDGFYNPITKCVVDADDLKRIIRVPTVSEHNWIIAHCRKAWDETAGYRPDLFENWRSDQQEYDDNENLPRDDPSIMSDVGFSKSDNFSLDDLTDAF